MKYFELMRLIEESEYATLQGYIDSGIVWKLEGSIGRTAMAALESGACMLPKVAHRDYYGNRVPARQELKKGTKGTYQNSVRFYGQREL